LETPKIFPPSFSSPTTTPRHRHARSPPHARVFTSRIHSFQTCPPCPPPRSPRFAFASPPPDWRGPVFRAKASARPSRCFCLPLFERTPRPARQTRLQRTCSPTLDFFRACPDSPGVIACLFPAPHQATTPGIRARGRRKLPRTGQTRYPYRFPRTKKPSAKPPGKATARITTW